MTREHHIVSRIIRKSTSVLALLALAACNVTKYVPDDKMLLDNVYIHGDTKTLDRDEMMDYLRQRPNVRILGGWRLTLGIYNLSSDKDNGWNRWLRNVGAEPVIYDSLLMERSKEQLKLYAESKGYYDANVSDTCIQTKGKRCKVVYHIDANEVYRVANMGYHVDDDSISWIVMGDTAQCIIKPGDPFDSNNHDEERARIVRNMQEQGYYNFGKESIYFMADSTGLDHQISDSLIVLRNVDQQSNLAVLPHRQSVIDTVRFNITYTGSDSLARRDGRPILNPSLLNSSCFIRSGEKYRQSDIELTQQRFNTLPIFNSTSIRIKPKPEPDSLKYTREKQHLECDINLVVGHLQSYNVSVEGTNSSGNLGGAFSIGYKHNNLFHNAEVFDVKFRISAQDQVARDGKERFFTLENGIETSLTFPSFVSPFTSSEFNRRRNPSTTFTLAYDFQRRPDFTKTSFTGKMNYSWKGSRYVTHSFTPLGLNVINIPKISDEFKEYISGTYLQYSYMDHFIMSMNHTFTFNQQKLRQAGTAWYVRTSIETAGNALSLFLHNKPKEADGSRHIWNINYSQYIKGDIELRLQQSDIWNNHFVYRVYAGLGVPYGNSRTLPFEKSYFVGGANSIRAWPVRALGPGTSKSDSKLRYHNQIGDMRFEMNAEYRFKMVSMLEGAIFADAGNIWMLKRSTEKSEETISSDILKQVALGAGLGFRLNFDYFIIRVDGASKMHDPSAENGKRWVIYHQPFGWNKINWNFAIGYPF